MQELAIKRMLKLDLCLIGSKGEAFFKRIGGNVVAHANHLGDAPNVTDLIGIVKVMLDAYIDEAKLIALSIVYNEFVNTMTQKPQVQQLLPVSCHLKNEELEASLGLYL